MNEKIRVPRYKCYLLIGKGHDTVQLPITVMPNKFHKWMQRIFFGFVYLDANGKEL